MGIIGVHLLFPGELETGFETFWMRVFPRDNQGSGSPSYVYILRDRRTLWSMLKVH